MAEVGTAFNGTKLRKGERSRARWDFTRDPCTWWQCSAILFAIFNLLWTTEDLPSDWIDASTCILFKKGDRSLCENYRGVSMLSVVGKTFANFSPTATPVSGWVSLPGIPIMLQERQRHYSYHTPNNGEKQEQNLYIAFIYFTKAFDCVNRELPFAILEKLGCPAKLSRVVKKLHTNAHARLINDQELSEPIKYESGVKQGCKFAPTLFGIYAAVLLLLAFKNVCPTYSINICFRYDGDIFDLRRLKSKTKVLTSDIREPQDADDIAIFCNGPTSRLQHLLSFYNGLAQKMGLRINTKKTETISIGEYADFHVNGEKVTKVDHFKYPGSYDSSDCMLDKELTVRIQARSCAVERVFHCRELTTETKLKVYNQFVIPVISGIWKWDLDFI